MTNLLISTCFCRFALYDVLTPTFDLFSRDFVTFNTFGVAGSVKNTVFAIWQRQQQFFLCMVHPSLVFQNENSGQSSLVTSSFENLYLLSSRRDWTNKSSFSAIISSSTLNQHELFTSKSSNIRETSITKEIVKISARARKNPGVKVL